MRGTSSLGPLLFVVALLGIGIDCSHPSEEDAGLDAALVTPESVGAAPINDPEYVVVIIIERGGSGGQIAAPTAKQIFQYLLNGAEGITDIGLGEDSER